MQLVIINFTAIHIDEIFVFTVVGCEKAVSEGRNIEQLLDASIHVTNAPEIL
jgi:hypothetical protein